MSIKDIFGLLSHLSLSAAIWLLSGLIALLLATWGAATLWSNRSEPAPSIVSAKSGNPAILTPRTAGLTYISAGLSNEQLKDLVATAQSEVTIVVPWFIDPLTMLDSLRQLLATDGARVTIYFLDAASPHLVERGRVAQPGTPLYGPSEMKRSLELLAPEFKTARARARILTYNSIPPAFIVRADNNGLIGFHMHVGVALKTPILLFDITKSGEATQFGAMITSEFCKLDQIASEVDLCSVHRDASGDLNYDFIRR